MGDHYDDPYGDVSDEEVKHVVDEDLEDWSWMHDTRSEDAGAVNATPSGYHGHRRGHSRDAPWGSTSSEESDEYAEVKAKPVKTKKKKKDRVKGRFEHLHELPLDGYSDPGYGGSDATLGEHRIQSTSQHARSMPKRLPPSRLHLSGGNTTAPRSSSFPQDPSGHVGHSDYEATHFNNLTLACDPPGDRYCIDSYDHEESNPSPRLDASCANQLLPESIYRLEEKPFGKVLKFVKRRASVAANASRAGAIVAANASRAGAIVVANASRTRAIEVANASRTSLRELDLKARTAQLKNLVVPVLTPILSAVVEESREQLMGANQGGGRPTPIYAPPVGGGWQTGQAAPMATPMTPVTRPGMPVDPRPAMRPVMRPGMRPGMPIDPRLAMMPVMRPGMRPPGMIPADQRPLMRPGAVNYPNGGQPMARRPSTRPPPQGGVIPRGPPGVAMRGQLRPMGAGRSGLLPLSNPLQPQQNSILTGPPRRTAHTSSNLTDKSHSLSKEPTRSP